MFAFTTSTAKVMFGGFAVALAMLASVAFGGGPAHAQLDCDARASLLMKLDAGFGERPIAIGLASTGNVVEVLISPDGTWTILVTRPNGISCIAAAGEHWQTLKIEPAGETS